MASRKLLLSFPLKVRGQAPSPLEAGARVSIGISILSVSELKTAVLALISQEAGPASLPS